MDCQAVRRPAPACARQRSSPLLLAPKPAKVLPDEIFSVDKQKANTFPHSSAPRHRPTGAAAYVTNGLRHLPMEKKERYPAEEIARRLVHFGLH